VDSHPQSGRVLPLRSVGGHRLAETGATLRANVRTAPVAALPDGFGESPPAAWKALAPTEQEGLVALMGELSLRMVRAAESGEDDDHADVEDQG
jgi:hypothetical protein